MKKYFFTPEYFKHVPSEDVSLVNQTSSNELTIIFFFHVIIMNVI